MKNFTFSTIIKTTTLILILSGCEDIDTTSPPQNSESEVLSTRETQIEQNSSLVIANYTQREINTTEIETDSTIEEINSTTEETNSTEEESNSAESEIFYTSYFEPEQNYMTQPVEIIPQPTEIASPTANEEVELNYTQKFINENRCSKILDKEFLIICYDYKLKAARSVAYTLHGDLVNELNIQERPLFYTEEELEKEYRVETTDYTHSGYDRGHLAPDASFDWSQESLNSTYSLANIIPQAPVVNRKMWLKAEKYARGKAIELSELNVVNVVKYSATPQLIGENNLSVSDGYYKMLFNIDKEYKECFYYANDLNASEEDDQLKNHLVDCDNIET